MLSKSESTVSTEENNRRSHFIGGNCTAVQPSTVLFFAGTVSH